MDPDSFAAKKHKEHKNFSGVVATDVSRRKFDFNWHKLTSPAPPPAALRLRTERGRLAEVNNPLCEISVHPTVPICQRKPC
jgi:hypothetical protein